MRIKDKDQFYHEATDCICASLDIVQSMQGLLDYLQTVMPVRALMIALACPVLEKSVHIQVGELSQKSAQALNRAAFTDRQITRFTRLNEYLGHNPRFSLANPNEPFPEWVQKISMGEDLPADINGGFPLVIARITLSNVALGIMWVIGKNDEYFTEEHRELIETLHNPIAIAISTRMKTLEAEQLQNTLDDERRIYAKSVKLDGITIIGENKGLKNVMDAVRHVAPTHANVIILGETGTGKELIAKAIHKLSTLSNAPLVAMNCAALPEQLLESELFGHAKGAFTGAVFDRKGYFELAHNGTIFLDEVAELSLSAQAKLLRVLQESELIRVGETKIRKINVRLIAATNRDLGKEIREGRFREDLYYRLNSFPIHLPPLRERKEDLQDLVYFFIKQKSKQLGIKVSSHVSPHDWEMCMSYEWKGNVRELEYYVERAVINSSQEKLHFTFDDDVMKYSTSEKNIIPLDDVLKQTIENALKYTHGVISGEKGAAALLELHPNTLRNKMDKLGIQYKK